MQPYIICQAQGSEQSDEWVRLGVDAHSGGRFPEAEQKYRQALRLDPRHAIAQQNLAIVFAQTNRINDALLAIQRAGMTDPKFPIIPRNSAMMNLQADRIGEALASARKAVEMQPDVGSWMGLALILATAGLPAEAIPLYNKILDVEPAHPAAGPNACFVQTLTDATPADLLKQRRRWYEANRFKGMVQLHDNDRSLDRPLRVGYVSGDFKSHSAAFIFRNVLLNHTSAVETFLYSSLPVDPLADATTKAFQDKVGDEHWRYISDMKDEDADRLIRRDRIDILVDLAGHTSGGRLALFTRKPAPIQITAWGFAHGTGIPEIDYFFADPVAVPEVEREHYAEKIWDLPCIVTLQPPTAYNLQASSRAPIHANGIFTFGSYSRFEKLSDECLTAFAEILRRVPDSRLQLKDRAFDRPYSIDRVMSFMPDADPSRVLFSMATDHEAHLRAYCQADLMLDTFPHSAGAVSLEVAYMSVPILTRYGTQPAGRTTSSLLTCMGRTNWIARSNQEYVEMAVDLATNRQQELADARKTLRQELLDCPAVKNYHIAVENAFRSMWKHWCTK